jgi:hypothetical protein
MIEDCTECKDGFCFSSTIKGGHVCLKLGYDGESMIRDSKNECGPITKTDAR